MQRQLKRFHFSGESLVEVVIAITVLTMILSSVFGIIARASSTNVNAVNRVVALNIAREGVEAVRNIRDTNWLKYSGDRRNKWLCLDTTTNATTLNACSDSTIPIITDDVYRVEFSDTNGRYFLKNMMSTLTAEDTLPAEEFRLYQGASAGRFSHNSVGEKTPFYRQVQLTPEDTWIDPACDWIDCPKDVRLRVLVRTQWAEGKGVRSLDLETYLYDYLGRDSY